MGRSAHALMMKKQSHSPSTRSESGWPELSGPQQLITRRRVRLFLREKSDFCWVALSIPESRKTAPSARSGDQPISAVDGSTSCRQSALESAPGRRRPDLTLLHEDWIINSRFRQIKCRWLPVAEIGGVRKQTEIGTNRGITVLRGWISSSFVVEGRLVGHLTTVNGTGVRSGFWLQR
jgi:hypothetical protein